MTIAFPHAGSPAAGVARVAQGPSSDESLIQRIADGDQLAMRTLFARHRVPLYRFVLRMVRNPALAEDILSEVFLDVWRQAQGFEGRSAVSTWLLAIARFKAFSALRRRVVDHLDDDTSSTIIDPADDPELVFQKKDRAELLRRAIESLSPEQSMVIDLVYYHEKSVREAAEIVGVPEATVKTRMFYARKRLAELVREA
jgi:RNA polymerase sigma-70 factor (ECF subfamily)